jgi:hypothetical protein
VTVKEITESVWNAMFDEGIRTAFDVDDVLIDKDDLEFIVRNIKAYIQKQDRQKKK